MAAENKQVRVDVSADTTGMSRAVKSSLKEIESDFKSLKIGSVFDDVANSSDTTAEKLRTLAAALKGVREEKEKELAKFAGNPGVQASKRAAFDKQIGKAEENIASFEKLYIDAQKRNEERTNKPPLPDKLVKNGALKVIVENFPLADKNAKLPAGYELNAEGKVVQTSRTKKIVPSGFEVNAQGQLVPIEEKGRAGLLSRIAARTMTDGVQSGIQEGIHGEGGLGSAAGGALGAGGGMLIAAAAAAVAYGIQRAFAAGQEQLKITNRSSALFGGKQDQYDPNSINMSHTEYLQYGIEVARSRKTNENLGQEVTRRAQITNAYGLNSGEVNQFDQFRTLGGGKDAASDATTIIANILKKSEEQGVMGVSKGDFTRLPVILGQISSIMSMQRSSGEKVDEGMATSMVLAGQKIGGRFADERLSEVMGRINSNIQSPRNQGMGAYMFEMMKRSNPNASFTDLLAMRENGASGKNLLAILPQIANMRQGENRRMLLHQLTGNWQDAIRLDSQNNLQQMIEVAKQMGKVSAKDSQFDDIKKRSETVKTDWDKMMNDFGAKWDKGVENFASSVNAFTASVRGGNYVLAAAQASGISTDPFGLYQGAWNAVTPAIIKAK